MTNYISDRGRDAETEAEVPDCFWNEGSYQDEFGKMAHSCSNSKFVLSLSETQIGSAAHIFSLVTIIKSVQLTRMEGG